MRLVLRDWVTVLNATATEDAYGNLILNWGAAVETVEPAHVHPASSDETVVNEDTVVTRWKVTLSPVTVATALSRVEWRGDTFEIDGDVMPAIDSRGRIRHCSAFLRMVTQ